MCFCVVAGDEDGEEDDLEDGVSDSCQSFIDLHISSCRCNDNVSSIFF